MLNSLIDKLNIILLIIFSIILVGFEHIFAEDNIITVYYDKEIGEVNKKVYGSNVLGLDPIKDIWPPYYYKRADYGTGIWNPEKNEPVKEVIHLAKKAGISIVRYATGNYFNWKNAVGGKRKQFLYGIDEFMKTLKEIGAEADFTLSYHTGDEQDAADFVEYLNAPYDEIHPWAKERAANGHPDPYGVKYFELGNEVFAPFKENEIKVQPEEYGRKYLAYQKAMKKIDPSIKLGLVLHHYNWRWDRKVLSVVGNKVDFVVKHIYPPKDLAYYASENDYDTNDLLEMILGSVVFYTGNQFIETQNLIHEITGKENVYHAITEFNIGVIQGEPQYRYSLGGALVNAELKRILMKPENKVLMANNWDFIEEYFGIVKVEGDYTKHDSGNTVNYVKRPNYYVYELYNDHFGNVLIHADVKGSSYDMGKYKSYMRAYINNRTNRTLIESEWLNNKWVDRIKRSVMRAVYKQGKGVVLGENLLSDKWEITKTRGVNVESKEQVLLINFKDTKQYNYYNTFKTATVAPNTYYKLSGYIKTEKLIDKVGVSISVGDGRGWTKTHSAAQTTQITEAVDWKYVEVVYKTLPDAKSVKVWARRTGKEGPLKGKAYFKDVKLQKYKPTDTDMKYLSVNASRSAEGDKLYLMVINKNMNEAITAMIDIIDFMPAGEEGPVSDGDGNSSLLEVHSWVLNGPSADSTNEKNADNVKVEYNKYDVSGIPFKFTYEPHSLTAIEIVRKDGI